MRVSRLLLVLTTLFFSTAAFSQQAKIDSLTKAIKIAKAQGKADKEQLLANKLLKKSFKLQIKLDKVTEKANAVQAKSDISMALLKQAVADRKTSVTTDEKSYQKILTKANKESLRVNTAMDKVNKAQRNAIKAKQAADEQQLKANKKQKSATKVAEKEAGK